MKRTPGIYPETAGAARPKRCQSWTALHALEPPIVSPSRATRKSQNIYYKKQLETQLRQISEALDTENPSIPAIIQYQHQQKRESSHSRTKERDESMASLTKELFEIQRHSSRHAGKSEIVTSHTSTRKKSKRVNTIDDALQITEMMPNLLEIGGRKRQEMIPPGLNKDYLKLSKEYKMMEGYRIHPKKVESEYNHNCVACLRRGRKPNKVFFPCEHKCVCNTCFFRNKFTRCPLCGQDIRITLEHTGDEQEQYWSWVEDVKPSLPITFLREFSRNKDCIKAAMTTNDSPRSEHSAPVAEYRSITSSSSTSESVHRIQFSCWKLLFGRKITPD